MFVEFVADLSFHVFLLSSKTRQSFRSAQKKTAGVQQARDCTGCNCSKTRKQSFRRVAKSLENPDFLSLTGQDREELFVHLHLVAFSRAPVNFMYLQTLCLCEYHADSQRKCRQLTGSQCCIVEATCFRNIFEDHRRSPHHVCNIHQYSYSSLYHWNPCTQSYLAEFRPLKWQKTTSIRHFRKWVYNTTVTEPFICQVLLYSFYKSCTV